MLISFEPAENRNLRYRIYRALNPISKDTELIDAELIAEITAEDIPYIDYPTADGRYAYAVTIVSEGEEQLNFVPFQNFNLNLVDYSPYPSSVEEIEIRRAESEEVEIHFKPLNPAYIYNLYVRTEDLSDLAGLSAQIAKAPTATLKGKDHFRLPFEVNTSYRFVVTTVNRLGVENRGIIEGKNTNIVPFLVKKEEEKKSQPKRIVRKKTNRELLERNLEDNFLNGRYRKALGVFSTLLKDSSLTDSEKAFAHLYMGQCYYYLGEKSIALKYFILAREEDEYKPLSDAWIERCISEVE